MYVESVVINFGSTQYNFYKSLRKDENELLDSTWGPTWLGRFSVRENTGDELFLNKYLVMDNGGYNADPNFIYERIKKKNGEVEVRNWVKGRFLGKGGFAK